VFKQISKSIFYTFPAFDHFVGIIVYPVKGLTKQTV